MGNCSHMTMKCGKAVKAREEWKPHTPSPECALTSIYQNTTNSLVRNKLIANYSVMWATKPYLNSDLCHVLSVTLVRTRVLSAKEVLEK
jgi:hypothetical protein